MLETGDWRHKMAMPRNKVLPFGSLYTFKMQHPIKSRQLLRKNGSVLLLCITGLICFCPLIGCKKSDSSGEQTSSQKEIPTVKVKTAGTNTVTDYVELVGHTSADQIVDIRARVSGFLMKVHFEDGQRVKAGDVLYSIQPEQFEAIHNQSLAQIEIMKAKVDLADKTLARSAKLLEQNAVSRQEYDQNVAELATAQSQVVAAQASAARTKLDVDYTTIYSPIDGRVDDNLIDEGNYITGGLLGGTILTTVVDDTPIKAEAHVDEVVLLDVLRRYRKNDKEDFKEPDIISDLNIPCFMKLSDEDDYDHQGKLEFVQRLIDQTTGTTKVRAVFDNNQALLRVGMFVRLKIPMSDPYETILVPDRAIGTDQASRFVYTVNDEGVIVQNIVEMGAREGKMRIIKSGVKKGEKVIVTGLQVVRPGMIVKTEEAEDTPNSDAQTSGQ